MSDDRRLNISISLAAKSYELSIPAEEEEVYRLAARRINEMVAERQHDYRDGYRAQDYLAMVALDVMVTNILQSRSREVGDEQMQVLAALAEEVGAHLAK